MKVAFLDRDGTIVQDYPDCEWNGGTLPNFLPGALDAMRWLKTKGYEIVVVTNQYLIGEGFITLEEHQAFYASFMKTLRRNGIEILDYFFCPHARRENCGCCKPKPGLIQQALRKYPLIDLEKSFLVGDSEVDLLLADACGLKFFGIGIPCEHPIPSLERLKDAPERV